MKFMVINGPNINMLGIREKEIYGSNSYQDLVKSIKKWAKEEKVKIDIYQSNIEGELINKIQECYYKNYDGIIINAGGYTHTSIALLDALKAVNIPSIEVHLTDISKRESFRHNSYLAQFCFRSIIGLSLEGYHQAIILMKKELEVK